MRKYKAEYIHYLFRAYASSMETVEHLDYLYETDSLKDRKLFEEIKGKYSELNGMVFKFIVSVDKQHKHFQS